MRKGRGRLLLWSALALCLTDVRPAAAQSYPRQFLSSETWVHAPSGMTFPATVGAFRKLDIQQYDETGLDVSAGYRLEARDIDIVATIYVYPAPAGAAVSSSGDTESARRERCREEFERRKHEVLAFNPTAVLVGEGAAPPPPGGPRAPGARATFAAEAVYHGVRRPVGSEVYVFCSDDGHWDLEYRITYPREAAAAAAIDAFVRTLRWTLDGRTRP